MLAEKSLKQALCLQKLWGYCGPALELLTVLRSSSAALVLGHTHLLLRGLAQHQREESGLEFDYQGDAGQWQEIRLLKREHLMGRGILLKN